MKSSAEAAPVAVSSSPGSLADTQGTTAAP